jgi:endonuclease YncB( thermonuclease family)
MSRFKRFTPQRHAYANQRMIRAALLLFSILLPWPAASQDIVAGRASVVDGDSIEIHGIAIRIHGIDAPESGQWCSRDQIAYRCGQEAAFALADKIGLTQQALIQEALNLLFAKYGKDQIA